MYRAKVVGVAGMERQLAVKRFHPQLLTTPGVSGRLSQAARTYGGLDHPRIARLAELGVAGGETFTAVEWVNGLDLARLLTMAHETSSALPAGASLALISAAARAIGYCHGRGISHLGLSPTNLIATGDGDVKVTDVGILACRLPPRPSSDPSLAARLAYLAPEQLIGEPVSAATDVFVLGVIAYELISGYRPFGGATALEIEQAVLSARPEPLELPRPVSRVIDRCLARSPFERFPDARALADALDAALRLSPLAGGKRDVADRVAAALEHIARINEQQLSGALSFAVPAAPTHRGSAVQALPLPPPARGAPAAPPSVPRPRTPPPSPVPAAPQGHTLRGSPPAMPRVPEDSTGIPTINRDDPDDGNLAIGDQTLPRIQPLWPPTEQLPVLKGPPPPPTRPLGSNPPPFDPRPAPRGPAGSGSLDAVADGSPPPHGPPHGPPPHPAAPPHPMGPPMTPMPPPPPPHAHARGPMPLPPPDAAQSTPGAPPRVERRLLAMMLVLLLAGVLGVGGFFLNRVINGDRGTIKAAEVILDAAAIAERPVDAAAIAERPVDAAPAPIAVTAADAGTPDDPAADAGTPDDPAADGKLVIRSDPSGARVFLDGADQGKTPVTVAGSGDRLNLALFLPGHDLYLAELDGRGTHDAKLTPVTPFEGPGGIKVRCKADDRYYVFLDGKPTGQLCPTERLGVPKGDHAIETYDLVSETRRQFPAKVKSLSRSVRVRID